MYLSIGIFLREAIVCFAYEVICPQGLWAFMKENVLSAIFWAQSKTTNRRQRNIQFLLIIFKVIQNAVRNRNRTVKNILCKVA